ncbi:hypothetical protein SAMN05421837_109314 [Amycolatopsis pretoriensis]|uniref:Uncharacterized protein n=2 Tax=Amycolatopsis pretoriensis TaxID=218821 RepID=A0A1H5RF69_9PSEU|nr:hypothetical protein [Amycolatopsis pretoriensis]SEF36157.1 hypothetical protein SAMN05421837_109314 [Amycolatopsis pretoriensis]
MAIPAAAGLLVVLLAWLAGPGLLGISNDDLGAPVQAEVTKPAACDKPDAAETVKFTVAGKTHEGTLNGCGHGQGERVEIGVPDVLPDQGTVTVRAADTSAGASDARRPIGLFLLVFACFSGGMFVYLWLSIPLRPKPAPKVS